MKSEYYRRQIERILANPNDWLRRQQLTHLLKTMPSDVVLPLTYEVRQEIAFILTTRARKTRPAVRSALQAGQVAALVMHGGLRRSHAAELVAAAWTDVWDKPRDPSGFRRLDLKRLSDKCRIETLGDFSFEPTGDPEVDVLIFSDEARKRIFSACVRGKHPVKKIEQFFHTR